MSAGKILIEKSSQAPPPSKDFHQLIVTETDVIWRTWKISLRKDQRYIPPSQKKVPWEDFHYDEILQNDISRVFHEDTLRHVHATVCGDWLVRLPESAVVKIASNLDLVDIARLGAVCRFLRKICSGDELWEKIFCAHCENVTEEMRAIALESGWKKLFFTNKLQLQVKVRRQRQKSAGKKKSSTFLTQED